MDLQPYQSDYRMTSTSVLLVSVSDANSSALGLLLLRFVVGFGFALQGIAVLARAGRPGWPLIAGLAMVTGGVLFALGLITVVGTGLLVLVTAGALAEVGFATASHAERWLAIVLLALFVTVTATGPQRFSADELLGDLDDKLSGFVPAIAIGIFAALVFGLVTARKRRVTAAA
jgi:uncharacterized membrane protein YphA (DoxX/SURF4 family)